MALELIQAIQALALPEADNQIQTTAFLTSLQDLLKFNSLDLLQIYTPSVAYSSEKDKKYWLEISDNSELYQLDTVKQAVFKPALASYINYWVGYSYSSPVFESSTWFKQLQEENASATEIAEARTRYLAKEGLWHAVLIKFHAKTVSFCFIL
jgi:hypothetical protein